MFGFFLKLGERSPYPLPVKILIELFSLLLAGGRIVMLQLFKFYYFHIIIDEVTLIGSQGSRFFLGDGIGALAGEEEERDRREDGRAGGERPPEGAFYPRPKRGGLRISRTMHQYQDSPPASTVQVGGYVVN